MTVDRRSRLLALAQELKARRARVERHLRQQGKLAPADDDDRFLQHQDDDVVQALDLRLAAEIHEVERALRRLDEGVYGRCERCRQAIGEARLLALPAAPRCADCARLP